jgi:hypothetical protein
MQATNSLIHSTSPYLLQHAHNPVQWQEWGPTALAQAQQENKLILVSIGYSACHWCHVMERESFENETIARLMNENFVCIKVDREERPDIDQIYMLAVQLMNGNGGWPLNVICLPDQRPVYGGTYFNPASWTNVLNQLANLWQKDAPKMVDYASQLEKGLHQAELFAFNPIPAVFSKEELVAVVSSFKNEFDEKNGGFKRAPKFPLPNNWLFLLRYSVLTKDDELQKAVNHYAKSMAAGGIYDQIGGGFARYSVDDQWHVPHFEKMLYDNAQLLSFYAEMYTCFKDESYAEVIRSTVAWLKAEMKSANGLFFSALDADSEGEEGKYYTWNWEEFNSLEIEHKSLIAKYFDVKPHGNWDEAQTNVLRCLYADDELCNVFDISREEFQASISQVKQQMLAERKKRIPPGLDDKCLTAWNALCIKGLVDAAQALDEPSYYDLAVCAAQFLLQNLLDDEGKLYRNYKNDKASVSAFLDDYAFLIDALIALYQYDFNEAWSNEALTLTEYVLQHFRDSQSPMLFYTSANAERLVTRKHEVMDNVIPSSNSVMAQNLQILGLLTDNDDYINQSQAMLSAVQTQIGTYASAYSNWCIQLMNEAFGINEIAIVGVDYREMRNCFKRVYVPNKVFLGGLHSTLPLIADKPISAETQIYICKNKVCQLPVSNFEKACSLVQR